MKLYTSDYKGKHFILIDEPEDSDQTIDTNTLNLDEHADACCYYGIPMYIGSNNEFQKLCDEAMERAKERDSEPYCYRCGKYKSEARRENSMKGCKVWGKYFKTHLWTDSKRLEREEHDGFLP